jgi:hypothetical protein
MGVKSLGIVVVEDIVCWSRKGAFNTEEVTTRTSDADNESEFKLSIPKTAPYLYPDSVWALVWITKLRDMCNAVYVLAPKVDDDRMMMKQLDNIWGFVFKLSTIRSENVTLWLLLIEVRQKAGLAESTQCGCKLVPQSYNLYIHFHELGT